MKKRTKAKMFLSASLPRSPSSSSSFSPPDHQRRPGFCDSPDTKAHQKSYFSLSNAKLYLNLFILCTTLISPCALTSSPSSSSPLTSNVPNSLNLTSSSPSSSSVHNLDVHSNANNRNDGDDREQTSSTSQLVDPIRPSSSLSSFSQSRNGKSLPNSITSGTIRNRQSKLGEDFPELIPLPAEPREPNPALHQSQNKAKNPGQDPSSMDNIIGGLLSLMGGNLKLPPGGAGQHGGQQQSSTSEKLANLLSSLGGPKRGQQGGPQRGPPIPAFASLPLNGMSYNQRPSQQFPQLQPGPMPMYGNFPFMPPVAGGRNPAIPLGGAVGGGSLPKLPPNLPPLNGMTKAEMDALYAQFLASGGPDKSALVNNLLKLAQSGKPLPHGLPPVPPGLLKPLLQPSSTSSHEEAPSTSTALHPTSFDTMHPMTKPNHPQMSSHLNEPPPDIITKGEEPSIFEMVVKQQMGPSQTSSGSSVSPSTSIRPTKTQDPTASKPTVNFATNDVVVQEIRNQHHHHQGSAVLTKESAIVPPKTTDIVYGKRIPKPSPSTSPSAAVPESSLLYPSFQQPPLPTTKVHQHQGSRTFVEISSSTSSSTPTPRLSSSSTAALGQPMVVPVEVDDSGIRPKIGGSIARTSGVQLIPNTSQHPESTRTIDATRTSSKDSLQPSKLLPGQGQGSSSVSKVKPPAPANNSKPYRRPHFRPRPNVPIVRIDTCIVGDDSTCDAALNEKCLTELGLSSCQCRPGFARIQPRTQCIPVLAVSLSFRIDRLNNNRVQFTRNLLNSNSEEYQLLEFESVLALNSLLSSTKLGPELMGVKVNRFYSVGGRTIANATVNLRASAENGTSDLVMPSTIKRTLQHEMQTAIAGTNNQLGESNLWVESAASAVTRVDDLNECTSPENNDCSRHARCINEFGTFRCECEPGYEDRYPGESHKSGRVCASCSPAYCSNRGECLIVRGERVCKCRANFIGAQCDIDAEVLGVAVGGSIAALIIIVITFVCLYMWNQRFKQEQQKIEAMSATSGHTFSYVNKHGGGPPTINRMSIDERYGRSWATHYTSDSQQHLLGGGSSGSSGNNSNNTYYGMNTDHHHERGGGQPVYATPVRVIGQSAGGGNAAEYDHHHHTGAPIPYPDYGTSSRSVGGRSLKVKSNTNGTTRQANLSAHHHGLHYPAYTMKMAGNDAYNETEFSTRELIYSPAHLYATNPRSHAGGGGYYS